MTCIICGTEVPEGRQVCPNCEKPKTKPSEIDILREGIAMIKMEETSE